MRYRRNKTGKIVLFVYCIIHLVATQPIHTIAAGSNSGTTENFVWPESPAITSESGIVIEASTGTILYEKNMHDVHYPASITKIMTVLLAIENCEMDEIVTVPAEAVYMENKGSHIALDVGEELTVEQCLYAIMLASANDAAYALAEHVGGKYAGQTNESAPDEADRASAYGNFIRMMNDRAEELCCQDTNFTNPHGLPDADHVTSAYDMALITKAALQYDMFRRVSGTTYYEIPPGEHQKDLICMYNHHKMIGVTELQNAEVFAGKNGYTDVARYTLVTCAQRDGMAVICVVLQASGDAVYQDTLALLNYGLGSFSKVEIGRDKDSFAEMLKKENPVFENCTVTGFRFDSPYVIIPKEINASNLHIQFDYEERPETVAAQYFYGSHLVGQVDVSVEGIQPEEPTFDDLEDAAALPLSDGGSTKKPFVWGYVLLAIAGVFCIVGAALKISVERRRYRNRLRRRRLREQNISTYRKQYRNR